MQKYALFLAILLLPISASAESFINRRDGYLLIWESIRRPAYQTQHASFEDIEEGTEGATEIIYGKRRGIIDKQQVRFRPWDPLTLKQALIWMYRTRNVAELPDMQWEHLEAMHARYPLVDAIEERNIESVEELLILMRELDRQLAYEEHEVSFYADDFHGKGTAFGETFDMNDITAAHRSLPHNTLVKVTNVANGKTVTVRINDRGPYIDGRNMDLSAGAFGQIASHGTGLIRARFLRLGDKDMVDQCSESARRYHRRITRDVRFHRGLPHSWTAGQQLSLGSTKSFVVRSVTYPDGFRARIQDFVLPEERFHFTPSTPGEYRFVIGTIDGRRREMIMRVQSC